MNKNAAALASSALLLFCTITARAQLETLEPQVSFSAWRVMSAGDSLTMEGPYHYAPGKHRSEMAIEGQTITAIVREDREVLWTLMPQQNMYMEVSFDSREIGNGGAFEGSEIVESRRVGTEEVNGQSATKYEVTVRDPGGETATGTLWATEDMIPVKMDMVVQGGDRVVVELRDIEVGPQPDELFEVPAGYTKLSLGAFGNLGNAFQGLTGNPPAPTDAANDGDADEAGEGAREGAADGVRENVGRRLRGIFNRE